MTSLVIKIIAGISALISYFIDVERRNQIRNEVQNEDQLKSQTIYKEEAESILHATDDSGVRGIDELLRNK